MFLEVCDFTTGKLSNVRTELALLKTALGRKWSFASVRYRPISIIRDPSLR
jgi:hypothetical protein